MEPAGQDKSVLLVKPDGPQASATLMQAYVWKPSEVRSSIASAFHRGHDYCGGVVLASPPGPGVVLDLKCTRQWLQLLRSPGFAQPPLADA